MTTIPARNRFTGSSGKQKNITSAPGPALRPLLLYSLLYPSFSYQSLFEYLGTEPVDRYTPGGYHPIAIGDLINGRYLIVDKLGFGGYSTLYVALKVGTASASLETKALRALAILSDHPGRDAIPSPLDEFVIHGPNGAYPCLTMVLAQDNLREASDCRLFPIDVVRTLVGGLTMAVAYMHSHGYVHGDIHLSNILVKHPSHINDLSIEKFYEIHGKPYAEPIIRCDGEPLPLNVPQQAVMPIFWGIKANQFTLANAHIILSDFGESFSPSSETRLAKDCHTPLAMRPPEARFEPLAKLSYPSDIWSLATAIWEILGMKVLFSDEFATEDEVVSQHIDALGPIPKRWMKLWEQKNEFFNNKGHLKKGRSLWPSLEQAFEQNVQSYRRKVGVEEFGEEETTAILDLMRRMLRFLPKERSRIEEVLQSEWMVKWVMPDFEQIRSSRFN
ncbi:uncharacterized protein ASPGLDRAFT_77691 [Aspergillus glaucus CBS 516.65]|uniref:non-specific serine/threonine protein kinase n=1 Tax=Aspergillus glaucus CBS 516.65 TaxID=1160497 RepID=A0A1L9V5W4_ASPGL|nr:hypothetical protein ASPGLDRAFT_77691 [Aspergillus glaucus CBS 516.65]OJJ79313.1 hypothetical protein ASPGLDRAFT_77691 [Aspergillus glaucus CBS 516.65]